MKMHVKRRGTTLLEVMAAMMVLAMTVSAAGVMFPLGAFLRNRSGGHSRAAAIVQRKLEQVRKIPVKSLSYSALEDADIIDGASGSPRPFTTVDGMAAELQNGTGTLELTGVGTDIVKIDVTVTWRNVRGATHTVTASTQVVNKGVWVRP